MAMSVDQMRMGRTSKLEQVHRNEDKRESFLEEVRGKILTR